MTQIAVLADIHGNLPALEAIWEDLNQFDIDHVVIAGDVINWGPFSLEVLEFLDERREYCSVIRGNHEFYLLDYDSLRAPPAWRYVTGQRLTGPRWIHHLIGDTWRRRIAGWPDTLSLRFADAPPVRVLHGAPGNPWQGFYADTPLEIIEKAFATVEETTIISAHTHLPLDRRAGRWHIVTPGSAGNPTDGIPDASYMLLQSEHDGWRATHRRVPFDRSRVIEELERQRSIAEHGDFGRFIIEEFRTARPWVGPYMLWRRTHHPDEPMTTSYFDEFDEELRREHTFPAYQINLPEEPQS